MEERVDAAPHPLGACPFCGSTAASVTESPPKPDPKIAFQRNNIFRVECAMCGAKTGAWGTAELAIKAWHRRPGAWQQQPGGAEARLWLWKNFVDGRPEYWAFDNPYPCHPNGDPMTLGEPCGYAIVKPSKRGRHDVSDAQVIEAIKRASARSSAPVTNCTTAAAPTVCHACDDYAHCKDHGCKRVAPSAAPAERLTSDVIAEAEKIATELVSSYGTMDTHQRAAQFIKRLARLHHDSDIERMMTGTASATPVATEETTHSMFEVVIGLLESHGWKGRANDLRTIVRQIPDVPVAR